MINIENIEVEMSLGNVVCAIIEIVEMVFFYSIFLRKREVTKRMAAICFFVAAMINVGKLFLHLSPGSNLMFSICLCIGVVFTLFKTSIKNGIFAAVVFIIIAMLSETLAQYLLKTVLGVSYNDISIDTQKLFAPLSISVNIIILLYLKKIYKKQLNELPLRYTAPIMIVPVITLIVILIFDKMIAVSNVGEEILLPFSLMLLYINFITFDFIDSYTNKIMLENAKEIIRIDKENYKLLESNEIELRNLRHDIRKHMQIINHIKDSCNHGIENQLERYIDNLQCSVNKITSVTYTGNEVLDSILNINGKKAKMYDIKYVVKNNIETKVLISDMDITTILCNALDNAIDAAQKTDEAVIVIYIQSSVEQVQFTIKNTSPKIEITNGELRTTKKDKKNHGYGLRSIKACVKKYDGSLNISYDNGIFTMDIKLNNKTI